MSPRWNWDFEDDRKTRRAASSSGATSAEQETRPAQIRRRRAAAAVVLVGAIALIGVVALGSNGRRAKSVPNNRARTQLARVQPHTRPLASPTAAVSAVLGYTPFVKEGGDHGNDVALTFDDGPGPYTPQVLGVLEHFHVRATFFEIGQMLRYFSASTVRELRDGDVIGDHTETHPEMATLSAHDQYEELFEQIARIEILGGPKPDLFRPPYGSFDATTLRELHKLHLLMVLWSVDTGDYLQPGVSVIVERALAGAHAGAIILMHDAGGTRTQTIAALPMIIRTLRARGFQLVTVPELLREDPPPPGQPVPSSLRGD